MSSYETAIEIIQVGGNCFDSLILGIEHCYYCPVDAYCRISKRFCHWTAPARFEGKLKVAKRYIKPVWSREVHG